MGQVLQTKVEITPDIQAFFHSVHDKLPILEQDQSMCNGTTGYIPEFATNITVRNITEKMGDAITGLIGNTWKYAGLWSNRLVTGGFHVKHTHHKGWMSGVCYVDVPESDSGKLEFDKQTIEPKTGDLVMFPSDAEHSVSVYRGAAPRLTIAFDVVKHA